MSDADVDSLRHPVIPIAEVAAIVPRVHAVLMRGGVPLLWNHCDSHTRLLWLSLAHCQTWRYCIDYFDGEEMEEQSQIEDYTLMPFEYLPGEYRLKLTTAPNVIINFLRRIAEVGARRG